MFMTAWHEKVCEGCWMDFDVYLHKVTQIQKKWMSRLIELDWSPWITRFNFHHSRTNCSRSNPERGFSDYLRIWGWNGLPAILTPSPLNTFRISLDVLFVSKWATQPRWLNCKKCWLKNGMPFHSSVRPAWGGGARLLWLCMVLPYATEAPVNY